MPQDESFYPAKLRWRISIMRSRAHVLGVVSRGGEDRTYRGFDLNEHDRHRLFVREE